MEPINVHDCAASSGPRIALALGGGSARGLAHIVVLEAFDELGLKPAVIAGTSMGSIIGAAFAAGLSAADIRAEAIAMLAHRTTFARRMAGKLRGGLSALWSMRTPGIVDGVTLFEMLLPEIMRRDFDALKIPFLAVAADYYAIEQVILDQGPLIPALAASSALPGLMRPVVVGGRLLIDGGYINPVPYDVVMDRADITVAVDVTGDTQRHSSTTAPRSLELITGATQILFHSVTREKLKSVSPDIFIRPKVGAFASLDYFQIGLILDAAVSAKEDLKRQLHQKLTGPP